MAIYSAIDCWEILNTATYTTGVQGSSASVTLGCAYANRYALASDLLTNWRVWPGTTGTGAPRVQNVTDITGWGNPTVQAASNDQIFDYEEGRVTVEYSPMAGDFNPDPGTDLILETLEGEVDGKRLSGGDQSNLHWDSIGGRYILPGEAPVRQVNMLKLQRAYIGLAAIPADIYNLIGYCTDAAYTSTILGFTFPAETLKMNYPYAQRSIRTNGDSGWNLTVSMTYKATGWNTEWRVDGGVGSAGAYETMYTNVGEYKNFPLGDFSNILS